MQRAKRKMNEDGRGARERREGGIRWRGGKGGGEERTKRRRKTARKKVKRNEQKRHTSDESS